MHILVKSTHFSIPVWQGKQSVLVLGDKNLSQGKSYVRNCLESLSNGGQRVPELGEGGELILSAP